MYFCLDWNLVRTQHCEPCPFHSSYSSEWCWILRVSRGDVNYMFILQFTGLLNLQFIRWKLQLLVTNPAHLMVQGLGEQVTKPCQSHISTDHGTTANGTDPGGEAEPLWLPGQGIRSRRGELHVTAVWMAACWAFWEGFIGF